MSDDGAPHCTSGEVARDWHGRWQRGTSGNPGGRLKRDREVQAAFDVLTPAAMRVLAAKLESGDLAAAQTVLRHSVLIPKTAPAPIDLGTLGSPADCIAAMARVSAALVEGVIDPDTATRLSAVVAAGLKVVETADLAERVRELQRQIEGMRR